MDISMILLWMAGIAVAMDLAIYFFSSRYRKYGGHIIGTMAYVILLTDLAFAVYRGECGTTMFQHMLVGTLVIGALFIIGYAVHTHRYVQLHQQHTGLNILYEGLLDDYKYQCEENSRNSKQIQTLQNGLENYIGKEKEQMEKHNLRVITNEEFEETLPDIQEKANDTRQSFQLYSLLISGYSCERGPKFESRLTDICVRICEHLSDEDIRILLQIDKTLTDEAGKFYDAS